jgi:hypothetical protein
MRILPPSEPRKLRAAAFRWAASKRLNLNLVLRFLETGLLPRDLPSDVPDYRRVPSTPVPRVLVYSNIGCRDEPSSPNPPKSQTTKECWFYDLKGSKGMVAVKLENENFED